MIKDLEESIYTAYDVVRGQIDGIDLKSEVENIHMFYKELKDKLNKFIKDTNDVCIVQKCYGEEGYTVSFKAVKNVEKFIEELKGDLGYEEE